MARERSSEFMRQRRAAPKTTSAMRPLYLLVGMVVILSGCVSQVSSLRSYMKNAIGLSIDELKKAASRPNAYDWYKAQIGWKETTYNLPNGNWVWVEVDRKDCFIHWGVNPQGIIVGARTEGKGCRWQ